jgi:hypothetical protein
VIIYGRAKTHLSEFKEEVSGALMVRRRTSRAVDFEGRNVYIDEKISFISSYESEIKVLPVGRYEYAFSCLLPSYLPASFEGSHGDIRYHIEAILDNPKSFNKDFITQKFSIVRQDDLNDFPVLKRPVHSGKDKRFFFDFLTCKSRPLSMSVSLPQSGFTPGQKVPVTIAYDNKSTVKVQRTMISLIRTIKFKW